MMVKNPQRAVNSWTIPKARPSNCLRRIYRNFSCRHRAALWAQWAVQVSFAPLDPSRQ